VFAIFILVLHQKTGAVGTYALHSEWTLSAGESEPPRRACGVSLSSLFPQESPLSVTCMKCPSFPKNQPHDLMMNLYFTVYLLTFLLMLELSTNGASNFLRVRSYISTLRKQGKSIFNCTKQLIETRKPELFTPK
jgi:hypothetical protein